MQKISDFIAFGDDGDEQILFLLDVFIAIVEMWMKRQTINITVNEWTPSFRAKDEGIEIQKANVIRTYKNVN